MTIQLGTYPIVLLLVYFRISSILLVLPFFGISPSSPWLLAAVSLPLTLLFASTLPPAWAASAIAMQNPAELTLAILGETLLGAAIGAVCGIFINAFAFAGGLASRSASLSMAEELDPVSGESSDILSQAWRMMFLVIILAMDAHLLVFRVIARTFETLPVPWIGWMDCGQDLALLASTTFRAGLSIALPVMVVSLLVSIAMALLARMTPEFSILFLSLPFRLGSAILMMSMAILFSGALTRAMAYEMLTTLSHFLGW